MGKNKIHLAFLVFLITLINLTQCTGLNSVTSVNSYGAVTNPTPRYANINYMYIGGGIYHRNTVPGSIGNNTEGNIKAEGCSHSVLFLFSWGNSGIENAKKSAGITKVSSIEYEQFAILGAVYHRFCTIVLGSKDSFDGSPAPAVVEPKSEAKTPAKRGK